MAAAPTAAIAAATAVVVRVQPHRVTAAVDAQPLVMAAADVQLRAAAEAIRRRAADLHTVEAGPRTEVGRRAVAADMGGNDMGGNTALGIPA